MTERLPASFLVHELVSKLAKGILPDLCLHGSLRQQVVASNVHLIAALSVSTKEDNRGSLDVVVFLQIQLQFELLDPLVKTKHRILIDTHRVQ